MPPSYRSTDGKCSLLTCVVVHLVQTEAGGSCAVPVASDAGAPVTADHGKLADVVTAESLRGTIRHERA